MSHAANEKCDIFIIDDNMEQRGYFIIPFLLSALLITGLNAAAADKKQPQLDRQERRLESTVLSKVQEIEIEFAEKDENEIELKEESEVVAPEQRGLVPQLWANYTGPALPDPETVECTEAQLKCAYRTGCGLALQQYVLGCSDLAEGKSEVCNSHCRHALIALTSTLEGQRLMKVRLY